MKFDEVTLQVLKNYSGINHAIMFREGNVLSTISANKTILAKATIEQNIPSDFAIYDLSRFLSTISLFDNPDVEIEENKLVLKEGRRRINYMFADPNTIIVPPTKEIKFPSPEVSFKLEAAILADFMKALNVLSLPEMTVVGDGENITLDAIDSKNPSADRYSVNVGKSETSDKFTMIIKAEHLKILPGDYQIDISSKGLSHFKGNRVEYWISVESNSKYGE
jgi:hypothetical protein